MRWSIIQLIWFRELRDQLRDRRTVFMIVLLPIFLYPLLGVLMSTVALGFLDRRSVVGVQGAEYLPPLTPHSVGLSPVDAVSCFGLAPSGPTGAPVERAGAVCGLHLAAPVDFPPLLLPGRDGWNFATAYFSQPAEARLLEVKIVTAEQAPEALQAKQIDALLIVPPDFVPELKKGNRPRLQLEFRERDFSTQIAQRRLNQILAAWKSSLKEARLAQVGLPAHFDDPIELRDADKSRPAMDQATRGLRDIILRIFPFLVVMWSLVGALYPAVDLCAGEKERGTMETLLISPTSREEIVWGKFLTIWVLSAATSWLNLFSMGSTTWLLSSQLPGAVLGPGSLFWCMVSVLPLSAFFSAVALALGVYARSTKEGQYYLMPLFLLTVPLVFLTLAPGVELNAFYSLVPVTGVSLLLQRLMAATSLEQLPWFYIFLELAVVALYSLLALRWAIDQFNREEVLFREAERLDLGLLLKRLFRRKEAMPSVGQAMFCFAVLAGLRWLFFGLNGGPPSPTHGGIGYLALLAPTLFMAVLLTTRPRQALSLRVPPLWFWVIALALSALLVPWIAQVEELLYRRWPEMLEAGRVAGVAPSRPQPWQWCVHLLTLALLPAVGEEIAFRGFILNGLRRRFSPIVAVMLASFFFGVYQMNLAKFLPAFAAGLALGLLAVYSRSILPGMLFHFLYRGASAGLHLLQQYGWSREQVPQELLVLPPVIFVCVLLVAVLLVGLTRRLLGYEPDRVPRIAVFRLEKSPQESAGPTESSS